MVVAAEFVMDASFAIPWIFRDEVSPLSDEAWHRLIAKTATAHVPALWAMEMVNVTLRGPHGEKPKPSAKDTEEFFHILRKLPLRVHHQGCDVFMDRALPLVRKHGLTIYDSVYLHLALATGLPLATLDKRMRKAAKAEAVEIVA